MTPHIGLKHVLNDELQVELKPHAWVKKVRERRMPLSEICPHVLKNYRSKGHGSTLLHIGYYL
jgi:hypothetical protein